MDQRSEIFDVARDNRQIVWDMMMQGDFEEGIPELKDSAKAELGEAIADLEMAKKHAQFEDDINELDRAIFGIQALRGDYDHLGNE